MNKRRRNSSESNKEKQKNSIILTKRIAKVNKQKKMNRFKDKLVDYYGKNYPIKYNKEFSFFQQWQNNKLQEKYIDEYFLDDGLLLDAVSFLSMVFNCFIIWSITIERFYQNSQFKNEAYAFYVFIGWKIISSVKKFYNHTQKNQFSSIQIRIVFKLLWKNFIIIFYCLFISLDFLSHWSFFMAQIFIIYLLYTEASRAYERFRIKQFALKYQNQMKIFDLVVTLFIQAHILAICLYLASKIEPENSWAKHIGVKDASFSKSYIYSIYFATTTMLTVGYGDIKPQNQGQVVVVLVVQVIGVVMFGYILNEMGHTLSSMRKQRQILEKDLQTIGKISKFYHLNKQTQNRTKKFLFDNQDNVDGLKFEEQNKLLLKLNDELRTEIVTQNTQSMVKSCIFFLCHWTKNFQNEVAKRLEKKVFSPNQKLIDISGRQKIYLIKKGKINIYANTNQFMNFTKKILRSIEISGKQSVTNNMFGYSKLVSQKKVNLEGVSSDFCLTYSLDKDDFEQCIKMNKQDLEYYHQIKHRILLTIKPECWEAPSVQSIREHFSPSITFTIKKYKSQMNKNKNQRRLAVRRKSKKSIPTIHFICMRYNQDKSLKEITLTRKNNFYQSNQSNQSDSQADSIIEKTSFGENISKTKNSLSSIIMKKLTFSEKNISPNSQDLMIVFEIQKEYSNYFKMNNLQTVLLKIERQNFQKLTHK